MKDETIIKLVAMICLTAVVLGALAMGVDSALVAAVAAIVGGIAGYEIKTGKVGKSPQPKSAKK